VESNQNQGAIHRIEEKYRVGYSEQQNALIFENRIEREWLTTIEAAHFLKISENALRIMVHRGQIPVYKFGRRLRFRLLDCQALFQKKGT
jgi:excisionase family DNA binding protein